MSTIFRRAVAAVALATLAIGAQAAYPDKPVHIVVPFGAGAGTDTLARGLARGLSEKLGQSVVVENRPGAGGGIGTSYVARGNADGYTLLLSTNGPMAANASLYRQLPYDPLDDFTPVVLMGRLPMILLGNNDAKATSLPELIEAAKAEPDTINFGASNTTARVWVELLKEMAGIDVTTVLYSDVGGMMTDLLSGRISYAFENVGPSLPQMSAGRVRALAVTSAQRAEFAPEVPTVAESGFSEHELVVWIALFAPKGTPADVVETLNRAANELLAGEDLRRVAAQIGMTSAGGSPADLEAYQRDEVRNWRELVEMTGVTID